jgi:hypothetical protein
LRVSAATACLVSNCAGLQQTLRDRACRILDEDTVIGFDVGIGHLVPNSSVVSGQVQYLLGLLLFRHAPTSSTVDIALEDFYRARQSFDFFNVVMIVGVEIGRVQETNCNTTF